jgi:hypothetical protein
MSLSVVVTVHCDQCGEWTYATDAGGNSNLAWRRAMGWTMDRGNGPRKDYCPRCSRDRETVEAT